jgi:hypothetical protein
LSVVAFAAMAACHGTNGDGGNDNNNPPPHHVGDCSNLAAVGTWENATPAQLNSQNWCWPGSQGCSGANSTYGAHFFALDPNNSGTVYLGTSAMGIWKSTDCGSTWTHINTGTAGPALDTGRNWSIVVDPMDSNTLYTCAGYGGIADNVVSLGLFKSTDGGVNWQQLFPASMMDTFAGGFIEKIAMDPTNHKHLTVSFHNVCKNSPNGGGEWGCLAETHDAGATWSATHSAQKWSEGDGQTMLDDQTWLYGDLFGGIWRTTNGGGAWDMVFTGKASGALLIAPDGTFYSAGGEGMLHSADQGKSWMKVQSSPSGGSLNGSNPLATDGTTLFAASGAYGGTEPATGWYSSAPLTDLSKWAPAFNRVSMIAGGGNLAYDADHKVLYSSNLTGGFWRVVVK